MASSNRRLLVYVLLSVVLLHGCSTYFTRVGDKGTGDATVTGQDKAEKTEESATTDFAPDTLYDLLVAELSGQHHQYDVALGNYLKQSHNTRDAGVARRAYDIAVYLGAYQASLDAALLWVDIVPQDIDALQAAANELIRDGKLERAAVFMKNALRLVKKTSRDSSVSFDILAANAEGLSSDERLSLLTTFDDILKDYPAEPSVILGKAILLQQGKNYQKALQLCDRLIRRDGNYVGALIVKGRILIQLEQISKAEKLFATAVRKNPGHIQLRLLYVRVLIQQQKSAVVKKQLGQLYRKYSDDEEVLLSIAMMAFDSRLLEEADRYFLLLLKNKRHRGISAWYLGQINEKKGQLQVAIDYYLQVTPGKRFVMAQLALSRLMAELGQQEDFIHHVHKARIRYPVYAVSLYLLEGEVLIEQKSYSEARKILSEGLERYPDNVNLLYSRAIAQEKTGNLSGLETDLKQILTIQPDNSAALNALGFTLVDKTTRLAEARQYIEKAYDLNSQDPAIIDSMGWLFYRLGNYDRALKFLKAAYEQFPDPEIAAHLGEVLWVSGQVNEALAVWQTVLNAFPDNVMIQETIHRLGAQTVYRNASQDSRESSKVSRTPEEAGHTKNQR
ncbi:Beta-barrel assembly-enhancing protease [invertebrate metagenome]|uniref:Beta-barrel assembly-enhancing protease n=1 Tax=invertebrate metagenome TaxID=1711999 RepID=A0A2H9T912_9ZZZZ